MKDYSKNPSKYLGKPKLPKYKEKDGRYLCELKNIQFKITDGYVRFSLKKLKKYNRLIKSNIKDKVMGIRIVPKGNIYILEIVYEKEVIETNDEISRILGVDLGVDNLATCVNNIGIKPIVINGKVLKSINQYYNKKLAALKSDLKKRHSKDWSNKLDRLQRKRDNKVDYYLHCSSRKIINHCIENNIDTIIIGLNKTWKQESSMNKKSNQNFISIPYDKFISQITYKAQDVGIKVITTEESYTSGCSFLDNEEIGKNTYNKSRRVYRGLFVSNKGIVINADCNGAYNITRKVVPEAFVDGIEGVDLHPIRVNI
nr:transposase [Clostridium perfringens]